MKYTVSEYETKQGSKGLILNVPGAPVVSTSFELRAGYRYVDDYDHKSQIPHIMEHMMAGSNAKYPDQMEYENVFTKNGAYHNAFTNPVAMQHVAACADFEWERIIELVRQEVCHPAFLSKYFKSESGNVRSELTGYLSQPMRMLGPKQAQNMGFVIKTYPEYIESLDHITLDDIESHYAKVYRAENMRFVIAGDFTGKLKRLHEMLDSFDLPTGGERLAIPPDEPHSATPTLIERKDVPGINFSFCIEMLREQSDAEDDAMSCLNHILTGTMSSRIYGQARQKGLLYGCGSDTSSNQYSSEWWIDGRANDDKLPAVFDLIVKELERVKVGDVSDQEIDDAKSYALGRHKMGIQTAGQLANYLRGRYYYDGTIRDFDDAPRRIMSVTKDEIVKMASEYFKSNIWSVGVYGTTTQARADELQEKLSELF